MLRSIRTVPSVKAYLQTIASPVLELNVPGAAFPSLQPTGFMCGRSSVRLALAVPQATNWKLCYFNGSHTARNIVPFEATCRKLCVQSCSEIIVESPTEISHSLPTS